MMCSFTQNATYSWYAVRDEEAVDGFHIGTPSQIEPFPVNPCLHVQL